MDEANVSQYSSSRFQRARADRQLSTIFMVIAERGKIAISNVEPLHVPCPIAGIEQLTKDGYVHCPRTNEIFEVSQAKRVFIL
ncbi:hypothetical protein ACTXT7_000880 [Hymenolepis weldensis]